MTKFRIVAALAAIGTVAAPAAAQTYGQPYGQPYPPAYGYPNQAVNPVQQIVDQLLGNRYNVNDRTAVQRCASAALQQAAQQFPQRAYGQPYGAPYGNAYGYNRNNPYAAMRVTGINEVQRVRNGVRVRGMISSGAAMRYGQQGYVDPRYPQQAVSDLQFRCNVDYRGAVTNLRVSRNRR